MGVFSMDSGGMRAVENLSEQFLASRSTSSVSSALTVTLDSSRPLAMEVQVCVCVCVCVCAGAVFAVVVQVCVCWCDFYNACARKCVNSGRLTTMGDRSALYEV